VFLAADRARLEDLRKAVRDYLAWQSIERDSDTLNLDAFQRKQAQDKHVDAERAVEQRILETYFWSFVPAEKKDSDGSHARFEWTELKTPGNETLAVRVSKRLKSDSLLITNWAGSLLRLELDRVPLWRGPHVAVKQLAEDFARYLYLPRMRDSEVLAEAISDGVGLISWVQDSFAYADGWDESSQRYRGLQIGRRIRVNIDAGGLLVKPDVAQAQLRQDEEQRDKRKGPDLTAPNGNGGPGISAERGKTSEPEPPKVRRFHGSVALNPVRLGRDANEMANEIVQHLLKQPGATVEVTIEIQAEIPNGAPDDLVRTICENCRTLKFTTFDFEED
jgi:hypothetical protein